MMTNSVDYLAMGERIRDLRRKKGLTQSELAEAADISTSFVGHIERGEKVASLETVSSLATCLGTSMDYIVLGIRNRCSQQDCPMIVSLQRLLKEYGV